MGFILCFADKIKEFMISGLNTYATKMQLTLHSKDIF